MKAIIELKPSLQSLSHAGRKGMKWGKKIFGDGLTESFIKMQPLQNRLLVKKLLEKKSKEQFEEDLAELETVGEAVRRMDRILRDKRKGKDVAAELKQLQKDFTDSRSSDEQIVMRQKAEEELQIQENAMKTWTLMMDKARDQASNDGLSEKMRESAQNFINSHYEDYIEIDKKINQARIKLDNVNKPRLISTIRKENKLKK